MNSFTKKELRGWIKGPCLSGFKKVAHLDEDKPITLDDVLELPDVVVTDLLFILDNKPTFCAFDENKFYFLLFERIATELPHPVISQFVNRVKYSDVSQITIPFMEFINLTSFFNNERTSKLFELCVFLYEPQLLPEIKEIILRNFLLLYGQEEALTIFKKCI